MAKKPPIRIALDLETTGLFVEQDAILEVAAIKFQGEKVLETFESVVAPGRPIPFRVQRLTGIKPETLANAPHFEAIAKKLQAFLRDFPIVGHSIPFDVGFLRRRGIARTNPLIDTFELANVLLPSQASYSLDQVAEALGVEVPDERHRAMADTVLAMRVFLALHQRLQQVDLTALRVLAGLDAPRSWSLLHFFRQELRERQECDGVSGPLQRGSLGDRFAEQLGMDPGVLSFAIGNQDTEKQQTTTITAPATPALPSLEQIQEALEVIPEQAERAVPSGYQTACSRVREALEQRTPLLIEVTVGGSDYALALLPALEWLLAGSQEESAPRRLVIACANQQHARRLAETTLPRLQTLLKSTLAVAYLAERGGYFCTHRWYGAALRRTSGELTAEQARGIAKLIVWARQTLTGEKRELTLLPQEAAAWERISSGVERLPSAVARFGTLYDRCTYRSKGYCFVRRAEELVNAAQIVVTTHAGLFDDLSTPSSLLTSITHRLILDADLLEDENARWSSNELDAAHLMRLLDTLGAEVDGRYQGLLAVAAPSLRENGPGGLSTHPTIPKAELDARMLNWFQTLRQARSTVEKLFTCFALLVEDSAQQGSNGSGRERRGEGTGRSRSGERSDQPLRLTGEIRNLGTWLETERTWQQTAQRLQAAIELAHEAEKLILTTRRHRHHLDIGTGEESSVASELAAVAYQLSEQRQLGQQALSLTDADTVYWLRMPPTASPYAMQAQQRQSESAAAASQMTHSVPILYSQLVQTSAQLKRFLLADATSTIFVGSALSVDTSFSFCRSRFGLEHDACPALSVVTEHHEQTLLYVPNDVPEPNTPQYQRHLDDALIQLATALDGQLLALFTSHAALRASYGTIKSILEMRGILVLAQGVDGSPRQLWQLFQNQQRVIVLGTGSFWESIDEVPYSPTCLFIARLPMPVLNDPPVAARAEHYSDQLHQYTVPIASLRLRRALNKLLWGDKKRNAVVLFDRRVISKEYGPVVLNSLPRCSQQRAAVSHMPETVLDWLTGTGAWE
jgi:ATP-dependent DNA helicase DinG